MDTFSRTLDSLRQQQRIPGLAVAIVQDGRVTLLRGFGYADVESRRPVTDSTPFNIASISKTISAVVALRLVERGVLDLDRPMASYAGFKEFCADVRSSGGIFFRDYHCDTAPITLRHVMSMTANGTPGERFLYNPPSYSWASRPMRQVTGIPFSTLVAQEVFTPAGMTHSARIHRELPLPPRMADAAARPYHVDSSGVIVRSDEPPPQGDGAAGGVVSTAADLARFDVALDSGGLLSAQSLALMWRQGKSSSGSVLPYGIGWFVEDYQGKRLVWHSGLWEGAYSALYLKVPAERLTLILLANSDGLRWDNPLDGAVVERSAFVQSFLVAFASDRPVR